MIKKFSIVLILAMILSFSGCPTSGTDSELVGTWENDNPILSKVMIFRADNTYEIRVYNYGNLQNDQSYSGTYTFTDDTITVTSAAGIVEVSTYTLNGNTLTITSESEPLVWTKQSTSADK